MLRFPVNACTDVTGFGLLGHLKEMVLGSKVSAEVFNGKVPVLPGVTELLAGNIIPGGTRNNLDYVSDIVEWDPGISEQEKLILSDAQTSGGLMISLPGNLAEQMIRDLHANSISEAAIIGKVHKGNPKIFVRH
jgi:selenide,water dikinase